MDSDRLTLLIDQKDAVRLFRREKARTYLHLIASGISSTAAWQEVAIDDGLNQLEHDADVLTAQVEVWRRMHYLAAEDDS